MNGQPRVVDEAAHAERVALDQRIAARIDELQQRGARRDMAAYTQKLNELGQWQRDRAAALRRETGMAS